jgi:hypothetical protein
MLTFFVSFLDESLQEGGSFYALLKWEKEDAPSTSTSRQKTMRCQRAPKVMLEKGSLRRHPTGFSGVRASISRGFSAEPKGIGKRNFYR